MEQLQAQHMRLLSHVDMKHQRSLMDKINWASRLIGIRGARGIGKTTMLLQHIKQTYGTNPTVALYASLDHLYFARHSLLELAEDRKNDELCESILWILLCRSVSASLTAVVASIVMAHPMASTLALFPAMISTYLSSSVASIASFNDLHPVVASLQ